MLRVNFNTYNNYTTDSLYQWDINQELVISGLGLTVAPEIHFANANMVRAIVRQSVIDNGNIKTTIPNSLLREALTIKAYVGVYEGETFKVIEMIEISVIPRKRPDDYIIEDNDEEVYSFNKLETLIEDMRVDNEQFKDEMRNVIDERLDEVIDDELLGQLQEIVNELTVTLQDVPIALMKDSWTLDEVENVYKQTIAIEGLSPNNAPVIALSTVDEEATEDELNAFVCLLDETMVEEGAITFKASEVPSISFTVIAKGVVAGEGQSIAEITALVAKTNELEAEIDTLKSDLKYHVGDTFVIATNLIGITNNTGEQIVSYVALDKCIDNNITGVDITLVGANWIRHGGKSVQVSDYLDYIGCSFINGNQVQVEFYLKQTLSVVEIVAINCQLRLTFK